MAAPGTGCFLGNRRAGDLSLTDRTYCPCRGHVPSLWRSSLAATIWCRLTTARRSAARTRRPSGSGRSGTASTMRARSPGTRPRPQPRTVPERPTGAGWPNGCAPRGSRRRRSPTGWASLSNYLNGAGEGTGACLSAPEPAAQGSGHRETPANEKPANGSSFEFRAAALVGLRRKVDEARAALEPAQGADEEACRQWQQAVERLSAANAMLTAGFAQAVTRDELDGA
jgi:hypothetical protein